MTSLASLALNVVDLQKELREQSKAIQMLSATLGQVIEAHNRVAQEVNKLRQLATPPITDQENLPEKAEPTPPLVS